MCKTHLPVHSQIGTSLSLTSQRQHCRRHTRRGVCDHGEQQCVCLRCQRLQELFQNGSSYDCERQGIPCQLWHGEHRHRPALRLWIAAQERRILRLIAFLLTPCCRHKRSPPPPSL